MIPDEATRRRAIELMRRARPAPENREAAEMLLATLDLMAQRLMAGPLDPGLLDALDAAMTWEEIDLIRIAPDLSLMECTALILRLNPEKAIGLLAERARAH